MDYKVLEKQFFDANYKYFEQNFVNQNLNNALYNSVIKELKMLAKTYAKFIFLENSIVMIKSNRKFWRNLDKETKDRTNFILKGVKMINNDIQKILTPISDELAMIDDK